MQWAPPETRYTKRGREHRDEHHLCVRRELTRFCGLEVDTAGDGFCARFDGPARAIRAACAIRDSLVPEGIEIRAGCTQASAS